MIVLTGASASGKTEVVKLLKIKYGIDKVVTHTTREIRSLEIPDEDYHFITKKEFQKMISENKSLNGLFIMEIIMGLQKKKSA